MKSFQSIGRISFLLLLFLTFSMGMVVAQSQTISGKITDERNRQPLAFVNIVLNGGQFGGMSDIDGKYEITTTEPIHSIRFSSIGYETKEIALPPDTPKCNIALKPITFELHEVTVKAGENPAHRIIDSVMAHRKANNPNSLDAYSYNIYDQMVITIDSSDFGKAVSETGSTTMQRFDSILKKSDLMVMETSSAVFFKAPDHKLQHVLGTKIAGMKEPTFIYLVNSMQSISFYDEVINITGTEYVNPISRNSKQHYFFTLESVNPIGQSDSLYVISFHPMRGSTFNGLRGTMTVNSDGWALQSVKASPNEQGGIYTATIQQLYQKIKGQWFPKQLNTNLKFPGMVVDIDGQSFPMVAIGKSYLTDIVIHPDLQRVPFSDIEIKVDADAPFRDETFWNAHRIDSLNERTKATYVLVDSLTKDNHLIDRMLWWTDKLINESAIPIGLINLDLGKVVKLSSSRGWYFGLGTYTNDRLSRHFRLDGFFGYWTRIHAFDYGVGAKWLIDRQRQMELSLQLSNKSEALGEFGGLSDGEFLLSENEYKYTFYENVFVRENAAKIQFATRFGQHFKGFLNLSSSHKHYNKQYYCVPSDALTEAQYTNAEVKLRFAYKEKFLSRPDGLVSLGTIYPIVWVSYQHSFPVLGGQFAYNRIKFEATQNFYTRYIGVSKVMLQLGYASTSCPVMETFDILGSNDPLGLYAPGSFSTMNYDENDVFLCDRFAALYLSHNFSGMLWKTRSKWFKPQLTLATNIGWGDMKRAESHSDKNFKTMEKGYFESGFVVKGLLDLPLVKVGAGVFYRYGPYAFDNVWNNFALKWSATFSL